MRTDLHPTTNDLLAIVSIAVLILTYDIALTRAAMEKSPTGIWLTESGDAKIRVSQCGAAICGKVVWLREPRGAPERSAANGEIAASSPKQRPVVGSDLFVDMMPSTENSWSGCIHDVDDSRNYAGTLTRLDSALLVVRRCDDACRKEIWTRAPRSSEDVM